MNLRLATCVASVFLMTAGVAQGQGFDLLGIKSASKTFDAMPDKLAEALLRVVRESDGIIGKRIDAAADKFNEVVVKTTDEVARKMQCHVVGTWENIQDRTSLAAIFFGIPKGVATNFQDLAAALVTERAKIKSSTPVKKLVPVYHDLLTETAFVLCKTGFGVYSTYYGELVVKQVSTPALEWLILLGKDLDRPRCEDIHECVFARRKEVEKLVKEADPRDEVATSAKELFNKVTATPAKHTGWDTVPFDIVSYETVVIELRKIDFALLSAEDKRYKAAQAFYAEGKQATDQSLEVSNSYHDRLNQGDLKDRRGTIALARNEGVPRALNFADKASLRFAEAAAMHKAFSGDVETKNRKSVSDARDRARALYSY